MAEPKKKLSKTRTRSRRHQIKHNEVGIVYCDQCHAPMQRHHICKNCGTYRGKKVVDSEEKVEAAPASKE
ncbi:MAG: 50S ribosomal protein L32 [Candidatus Berkelbacteria bacterium]